MKRTNAAPKSAAGEAAPDRTQAAEEAEKAAQRAAYGAAIVGWLAGLRPADKGEEP